MSPSLSPHLDGATSNSPGSTGLNLRRLLSQLCDLAGHSVGGVEAAAVTLLRHGMPVLQSSSGFARAADRIQYRTGEGPCVDAALQGRTVVSGRLGAGEARWPQFVAATRSLAVASVLSLPLTAEQNVIGSINLYSRQLDAFDDLAVAAGKRFARPAAASLSAAWSPNQPNDAVGVDDNLPAELVHGIEAVVAGVVNPALRSATISRIVEEMFETLSWTLGKPAGHAELGSFAQVLVAVYSHEGRAAGLHLDPSAR